jgi:hypothetical protein
MIGDIQQLAPVVKDEEWDILKQYHETPFFREQCAQKGRLYHHRAEKCLQAERSGVHRTAQQGTAQRQWSGDFGANQQTICSGHFLQVYSADRARHFPLVSDGISVDDALIAATAIENNVVLVSGNSKHYKPINELKFKRFFVSL